MANNVYWEDVEVGQKIKTCSRQTDLMSWNRYAAGNDELLYIHMDHEEGRAALNGAGALGLSPAVSKSIQADPALGPLVEAGRRQYGRRRYPSIRRA